MPRAPLRATGISLRTLPFLEFPPEYLAGGGLRQLLDELHEPRHLERRHAATRPLDDVLGLEIGLARHDHRFHRLAAIAIGRADDAGLLNAGVRVEHRLDLRRPYLVARRIDHALQPVGDEEVALVVVIAEVAGAEEILAVVLDERFARRLLLAPVAFEQLRPVDDDLAHLANAEFGARLRIDDARIGIEDRDAAALALRPVRRVDVRRRHGLAQPIALDVRQADDLLELARERLGHRGAAAAQHAQR